MRRILATAAALVAAVTLAACSSGSEGANTNTSTPSETSAATDSSSSDDGGESSDAPVVTQTSEVNEGSFDKDTINIDTFLDMTTWDPALADIGFEVVYMSAVYDPLIALDADSNPIPALATEWEWSDDGLTLTMKLRDGITFDDGTKFDADAAVVNLNHLKDGVRSQEAYVNVDSIEKVDDMTIQINMKQKDDAFLYFLGIGRSWMTSPKAIEADDFAQPQGSGPYIYDAAASTPQSEYHFHKRDGYWDDATFPFQNVTLFPIFDGTAGLNAMLAGQVDMIYGSTTDIQTARDNGWNIFQGIATWAGIQFADFNGERVPALKDLRVRQAIAMAYDAKSALEANGGDDSGVLTNQAFPVGSDIEDPSLRDMYAYDLDKAKQLMADAGYADGFQVTMPMSIIYQSMQPAVEQALNDLGITVTWEDMSPADYQAKVGTYPMYLAVIALDSNDVANVQRQIVQKQWYNPQPAAEMDPAIGELATQALAAIGDEQTSLIKELNKKVTEFEPRAIWSQGKNTWFTAPGIQVTPITGTMFPPLRYIQKG